MDAVLALGGGGVKGLAHIGVLETLERAGIKIKAIAGTSAGGLVGAAYASGKTLPQITSAMNEINSLDRNKLFARRPADGPSLLGYGGLVEGLTALIGDIGFEELKIPFACTAVDLATSKEIWMRQGRILPAALATMAVPGIFPPKMMGDLQLVDGGVLNPVPVSLARRLAPGLPIIAVSLGPSSDDWDKVPSAHYLPATTSSFATPIIENIAKMRLGQSFNIFVQYIDISSRMLSELRLKLDQPDLIIRPDVARFGILDNVSVAELIAIGRASAIEKLPEIEKLFSWQKRAQRYVQRPGLLGSSEWADGVEVEAF